MAEPLGVLALMIDKPGHRHQTEGVARVIARMRPSTIARLEVRARWFAHASVRYPAVRRASARGAAGWLRLFYGIDVRSLARPDVIVASGRPAIAAGILLGRAFGAPFVYAGLADRVPVADLIDLTLVSVRAFADRPNAVFTPVPSLVEPDRLPPPRLLRSAADLRGARVGLLLGGDAHSHRFSGEDWAAIGRLVERSAAEFDVRWLVSTSRRSGPEASAVFRRLADAGVLERFIDWGTPSAGPVDALFEADAIVVTEDSVSMTAEAVEARRPVVALRPAHVKPTLVDAIVGQLVESGHLAVLPVRGADPAALAAGLLSVQPMREDWRDQVAAAVARVLPAP
jgi:mitochondrial fission protein ELM1